MPRVSSRSAQAQAQAAARARSGAAGQPATLGLEHGHTFLRLCDLVGAACATPENALMATVQAANGRFAEDRRDSRLAVDAAGRLLEHLQIRIVSLPRMMASGAAFPRVA